jgi:hypothetical protein
MLSKYYYFRTISEVKNRNENFKHSLEILKQIQSYIENKQIYCPMNFKIAPLVREIKLFLKNDNFHFIEDYSSLNENDIIFVFSGNHGVYSKIKKIIGNSVFIKSIENIESMLIKEMDVVFKYG